MWKILLQDYLRNSSIHLLNVIHLQSFSHACCCKELCFVLNATAFSLTRTHPSSPAPRLDFVIAGLIIGQLRESGFAAGHYESTSRNALVSTYLWIPSINTQHRCKWCHFSRLLLYQCLLQLLLCIFPSVMIDTILHRSRELFVCRMQPTSPHISHEFPRLVLI